MGVRPQPREDRLEEIKVLCVASLVKIIDKPHLDPVIIISKSRSHEIIKVLKEKFRYLHLSTLTACDNTPAKPRFHLSYHLYNFEKRIRIMLKVEVEEGESVHSIVDIWAGANWLEREAYDMFGIVFAGHPNLRRLYLPEEFKGHPLRKEFPYSYRQEFSKGKSS